MTPSLLPHDCPHTNRSRRHSTANVHPRARLPILSALTPQTSPRMRRLSADRRTHRQNHRPNYFNPN